MSYVSKKTQIKAHLLSGKSITPLQALSLYGSLRLGAVIFDLRNEDNMIIAIGMIANLS